MGPSKKVIACVAGLTVLTLAYFGVARMWIDAGDLANTNPGVAGVEFVDKFFQPGVDLSEKLDQSIELRLWKRRAGRWRALPEQTEVAEALFEIRWLDGIIKVRPIAKFSFLQDGWHSMYIAPDGGTVYDSDYTILFRPFEESLIVYVYPLPLESSPAALEFGFEKYEVVE